MSSEQLCKHTYSLILSAKKEDYNAVFKQKLIKDQRKSDVLRSKGA